MAGEPWGWEAAGMRPQLFCSRLNSPCTASPSATPQPLPKGCCGGSDAEDRGLVLHTAHTHTVVMLLLSVTHKIWAFKHLKLTHLRLRHTLPPSTTMQEPFLCLWSIQHPGENIQAGRNPPCPSRLLPLELFSFPPSPPPFFFILNKNIITGF